jgi:hypothetical protein
MPSTTALVPQYPVDAFEIRNMTVHEPGGETQAYQVRYKIADATGRNSWTPWLRFSHQGLVDFVAACQQHMQTQGHLAGTASPGRTLQ